MVEKNNTEEIIHEVELLGEPTLADIWRLLKSNTTGTNIELKQQKELIKEKFADVDNQNAANKQLIDNNLHIKIQWLLMLHKYI